MNFCHIWTPRHALYPSRFTTLNMDTCFAPQWCAFFQHLNLHKWPRLEVFSAIWLGNVLQGTTACIFSTSQVPEAFQHWGALHILTWKCAPGCTRVRCSTSQLPKVVWYRGFFTLSTWKSASCHNGVQFFIFSLGQLRTCRFGKPKFRPAGARKHWKNQYFAIFLHFCLLFSSRLFSSLTFSSDFLLCLSSAHSVRSLTSKLPPIIHMYI